ncbi:DUF1285 domain-containing protein [Oecophyllibacter saccharovorans]|uniref:DUF1285 domain-containing protein n=1 Tax=Oecophyllibacter saccharovorans TaxID=2558360 RepID=UPI0018A27D69|nr:DUF1285 domain-containing protein [Oecophyllibacter saccharovorans]
MKNTCLVSARQRQGVSLLAGGGVPIGQWRQRVSSVPRLPFRIRKDGTWYCCGQPVRRKELRCLFASMMERDAQGRYWLDLGGRKGVIEVEDAPFLAVALDFTGSDARSQNICLRTNTDELISLGQDRPLHCDWQRGGQVPAYVEMGSRQGGDSLLARVSRPVMFELTALAIPERVGGQTCLGVWSRKCFFPLTRLDP